MSRTLNKLTARQISALHEPGRHADGGGLYLRITPQGSRSWVFMTAKDGKRAEIGLGAAAAITLATARRIDGEMRDAAALGLAIMTFKGHNRQFFSVPLVGVFAAPMT